MRNCFFSKYCRRRRGFLSLGKMSEVETPSTGRTATRIFEGDKEDTDYAVYGLCYRRRLQIVARFRKDQRRETWPIFTRTMQPLTEDAIGKRLT
jgi:hypothetical protein